MVFIRQFVTVCMVLIDAYCLFQTFFDIRGISQKTVYKFRVFFYFTRPWVGSFCGPTNLTGMNPPSLTGVRVTNCLFNVDVWKFDCTTFGRFWHRATSVFDL